MFKTISSHLAVILIAVVVRRIENIVSIVVDANVMRNLSEVQSQLLKFKSDLKER